MAIDLAGQFSTPSVHTGLTATDFTFKVGASNSPANWANAPPPSSVIVLPGGGTGGSDRVEITWPDGAIINKFLEVTLKADGHSGLAAADTFYFGNLIGDSGFGNDEPDWATTDVVDFLMARAVDRSNAPVTSPFDFDRSGTVDVADWLLSRAHAGSELELISLGAGSAASPAAAAAAALSSSDLAPAGAEIAFALGLEASGPVRKVSGSKRLPSQRSLVRSGWNSGSTLPRWPLPMPHWLAASRSRKGPNRGEWRTCSMPSVR